MMPGRVLNIRQTPREGLDFFPTPPWATRALLERLAETDDLGRSWAWEPACGEGDMARVLAESFAGVRATDIVDRGWPGQAGTFDFIGPEERNGADAAMGFRADWIITNPPFNCAGDFARTALKRARKGVALLVKQQFLEGIGRFEDLFDRRPPAAVLQFAERVPMVADRLDAQASTNQSYCWVIWRIGAPCETRLGWIGPCRYRLTRVGDYPPPPPGPLLSLMEAGA
jgi:hypothetical protein